MNRSGRALVLAFALGAATAITACQSDPGPGGSSGDGTGPSGRSGSIDPGMTLAPPPSPTPDDASPAVLDPALLEYLPMSVGGAELVEEPNEAAVALADPTLSTVATALDVGLAVDEARRNLVTAHVVRLREGAFADELFRQWRDTFDQGACARAGGVDARLEVPIAERTVYVTSCSRDLRTYHLWIPKEDLLISAASVGEARFGEVLMTTLRVPE